MIKEIINLELWYRHSNAILLFFFHDQNTKYIQGNQPEIFIIEKFYPYRCGYFIKTILVMTEYPNKYTWSFCNSYFAR